MKLINERIQNPTPSNIHCEEKVLENNAASDKANHDISYQSFYDKVSELKNLLNDDERSNKTSIAAYKIFCNCIKRTNHLQGADSNKNSLFYHLVLKILMKNLEGSF